MAEPQGISKDEVALYDRQIRLWGLAAQNLLRQSTVKIHGIKTLTLELSKNLVLAGIGTLILVDPSPISDKDLETQYYFHEEHLGSPRDQVLAEKLRVLNPLVIIQTEDTDKCDVVVDIGDTRDSVRMDAECREKGQKYIRADCFGLFGYFFIDCLENHEYIEETKVEGDSGETNKASYTASYISLAQSVVAKPGLSNLQPLATHIDSNSETAASTEDLEVMVAKSLEGRGMPEGVIDQELLGRVKQSLNTEFVPSASVVGGTLAQEVLKIVTHKDLPMNNWYVFDAIKCDGITCQL
ncbi:E1 ubiquitin-activating protein aos1 [Coemansia erecta]|uniref:Ubiquitin-like 1-activating enzyme E1A n=1 Tax=Coemansia erecta TaxID=147472 RepID=A0A9W7XUH5_9FUNG|nr:E1 ubiquitin-activating protein aos1 [Coemansia erecta]